MAPPTAATQTGQGGRGPEDGADNTVLLSEGPSVQGTGGSRPVVLFLWFYVAWTLK